MVGVRGAGTIVPPHSQNKWEGISLKAFRDDCIFVPALDEEMKGVYGRDGQREAQYQEQLPQVGGPEDS